MSTRSHILMELEDGHYKGIYCQFDGYLTHNGAILLNQYSNRKKLDELLNLGDLRSLGSKINPNPKKPHDHDHKQDDVCYAYGRDGHESNQKPFYVTKDEMFYNNDFIDYFYVFTLKNEWKYYDYNHVNERDVRQDLKEIYEENVVDSDNFNADEIKQYQIFKKKQKQSDEEM